MQIDPSAIRITTYGIMSGTLICCLSLADMGEGHNIVSTVFMECGAMYRADGLTAEAPLGETEFVNSVAAMSASGRYGPPVCAGIVGFADCPWAPPRCHTRCTYDAFAKFRAFVTLADGIPAKRYVTLIRIPQAAAA